MNKLRPVPAEFQELMNIEYIQTQEARDEIMQTIVDITKLDEDIDLKKDANGNLQVYLGKTYLLSVVPLRPDWQVIKANGIAKLTVIQLLKTLREVIR